jgi:hypothetical protein
MTLSPPVAATVLCPETMNVAPASFDRNWVFEPVMVMGWAELLITKS